MIKMMLRWAMPYLVRELKKSQAIWKMTRVFLTGGSVVDILQELTKMTSWEWDDKMLQDPAAVLVRSAIDDIDGEANEGVKWYDLIIETLGKSV